MEDEEVADDDDDDDDDDIVRPSILPLPNRTTPLDAAATTTFILMFCCIKLCHY